MYIGEKCDPRSAERRTSCFCCSSHEFGSALVLSLSLRLSFRLLLSHGTFRGLAANELLECIRPSRTLTAVSRSRHCTREQSTHTTRARYSRRFHAAQRSHEPRFSTARTKSRLFALTRPPNRSIDRPTDRYGAIVPDFAPLRLEVRREARRRGTPTRSAISVYTIQPLSLSARRFARSQAAVRRTQHLAVHRDMRERELLREITRDD